jgi:protoheme IX farnesyltransferase
LIAQVVEPRGLIRDYVALTKPRILSMLLLTALCAMFLAAGGVPELSLIALVLGGGALAAGGAHALNHYIERDSDSLMRRTKKRPVASGRVSPQEAMWFGIALNVVAFVMLTVLVNPLAAALTLSATLFYVFVYTIALKRKTPQNIVIGGAAGAVPPLAAWAAVTGTVELPAVYLFAIIFFWTPPHFWALALMIKDDYLSAGIPMLPVVTSVAETKRQILLYTFILVALTLMFVTTSAVGWFYFATAAGSGLVYIYYTWRLYRLPEISGAKSAYLYSLLYLALIFVGVVADVYVRF